MPFKNRQLERNALLGLHAKLGTWKAVAEYLQEAIDRDVCGTTVNMVSKGRRNSRVISLALQALELVPPQPRPMRRCVSGSREEIEKLEKFLYWNGYKTLGDFVWQIVNHEEAGDFWKGKYGVKR